VENAPDNTHVPAMSRAFVNEDDFVEDLPDRPIPEHPNLVTANGLALIEAALQAARREHGEAQAAGDRAALASAGRELRYWSARRASAQLVSTDPVSTDPGNDAVQFGTSVTIIRDDGRQQSFVIVGSDEADPAKGTVSYVSPLARALVGKHVGDVIKTGGGEAEITAIRQP
jgi:transcription elongation GreA/GreB family factor